MNARTRFLPAAIIGALAVVGLALADAYVPADRIARAPPSTTEVLPERFLRGFDPITVTFTTDVVGSPGPADDTSLATLKPAWPGAWSFVDKRTLQFRPAEAWPALHRFAVEAKGKSAVLTTMMTAPTEMQPADGARSLPPFRTLTLAFPQPLPLDALKAMIRLEVRALPGVSDSSRRRIDDFQLSLLPRSDQKEPAVYAIGLADEVPEGALLVVTVALALGDEESVLWTARAATRTDFRLDDIVCAGHRLSLAGSPDTAGDQAIDCGSSGEQPQLVFSSPVGAVSLTALKKLVRLEPAVADLRPVVYGNRVSLVGSFVPDTLYRLRIADAPILDDLGRRLQDPGEAAVHFFVGWKQPWLRSLQGRIVVEANGPRQLPMSGYGDTRADVRLHRIDPRNAALWRFSSSPMVIDEESAPPFPGEEPSMPDVPGQSTDRQMEEHIRLLGSPLVSRIVDLPLKGKAAPMTFGLDVGALIDSAPGLGKRMPGTYLVGVRRLQGRPQRSWSMVQVTNLSVTSIAERERAVFFVRTIDTARPVSGASITIEAMHEKTGVVVSRTITTDNAGRASLPPEPDWQHLVRVVISKGNDTLVIDPSEPPPRFFENHWSSGSGWLPMLTEKIPVVNKNDAVLGFLFSERPIYRPGEKVFLKGWVREKNNGLLAIPAGKLTIKVTGPDDAEYVLPTTTTALAGGDAVFAESNPATGSYTASLFVGTQTNAVATRRFQIEAYRLPTFEVQLTGSSRVRLDQPFTVRASARYYAGGNVAEQPIRWNVSRRPAWHTPKGREGFLFASSSQFARPESQSKPEQTERSGTLADDGSDAITMNPEKDLDGSPRLYRFEATVTGADDQEVSAVTEVLALPPFVLGMKLDRFKKTATSITPELIAVGVDDKLVAGQKIDVRLFKRTWHSHLRESHFATGEASYVTQQEDTKILEQTATTTTSPLAVSLPVQGAGVYVVELVSKDKLGRVQTLSADLYIGGKEPVSWAKGQAGVFELVPDNSSYVPGQTANVVIKSPFAKAAGLLIIERPTGNDYRPFDVVDGNATVAVAIDASMTPNVPVHVVLSRGRLGDSPTDDGPYRPQTMASSLDLEVEPSKQQVKVSVTHPPQARPGDTVAMTVKLADVEGKPLAGEVALWIVDEAVLSLAKEGPLDPLTAMVVRNERDSTVWDTRNSVVGRLIEDESPGGDGDEDANGGAARRRVRKNFQTVPFWQASVVVPASGHVEVKVPLSDDLTTFVVRAVAASGAARFGHVESKLKVRLPVIVQPQLPRFVRQGDRFEGGAVARLVEGAGGAGVVKAEYTGPVVERKRSRDINLVLDKATSVTFPVEVAATASTAPLKVKMGVNRKSDGVGDAFEVTIPVLPDVPWQHSAGVVELSTSPKPVPGPAEAARKGTATQTIVATTVVGLLETVSALEYLERYPHGCLEQKLAKLEPAVAMATLSAQLGGERYSSGARAQVERLLQEFALHQDDVGLLSLWPGGRGDVQLTASALRFAAAASSAGMTVDKAVVDRARAALTASLRSDYAWSSGLSSWRTTLMASSLRALSLTGGADDAYLTELLRSRKTLDATGRADLALAVVSTGKDTWKSDLDAIKSELWSSVTFNLVDGRRTVVGVSDPRAVWGRQVLGSSTSTLATVLEALVRLDPKNADLALVFEALLRQAKNNGGTRGFGSTWDNRAAISAIAVYLSSAKLDALSATITIGSERVALDNGRKVARVVSTNEVPLSASTSKVPTSARASWRVLPATTGDRLPARKAGLLVTRGMSIYPVDGGAVRRVDDVRAAEQRFQVGDVVELHAQITSDEARYNVAVVVPFAAGFEPLNPALATSSSEAVTAEKDSITPSYVARLDDEVRYYFGYLPKGTATLHLRIKALTPGSYTHPGAYAELMYDESVGGRSDGSRAIIERGAAE